MSEPELSKRIEELDTGKHDPESLCQIALKLHKEGYPPTLITQMLKRKFGRGVPLTIFGKKSIAGKSVKSKISALKTVQAKISRQITAEANERVTRYLKTGKRVENQLAPVAREYGYEDTGEFIIERVYKFFADYYNHVRDLEKENNELRLGVQKLLERFAPEAKRRLVFKEVMEFVHATTLLTQLGFHPVPPDVLRTSIEMLSKVGYNDVEASLKEREDPAFWTKKYVKKAFRS